MTTQEDRTLKSGMSFPKWMKSRMNDRFDLDQSTFSPPELDDSFMHYYRQSTMKNDKTTDTKMVEASTGQPIKTDFSHISAKSEHFTKPRPKGTDDGFKSEASQVGNSILRVASQIVSGKRLPENRPEPAEECEQLLAKFDPYRRRGSKSLPASPLSSPKSRRRMNKFFTSPYVEADKSKGWILASLLAKREFSQSMGFIGEEKKEELERAASTASMDDFKHKSPAFQAKPSELREMNFWSPTSM
ncbi:uncharacterized protein LOC109543964 isoform X1 [Dendroctonus ponderosae]|uniref:Uncharacterized protein n=1 Tax=Dendroctonus ponderosae TaxID=77166 RepID=U4U4E3_DENPD|nr:uncharacterized protein LOC109543964 isoform X1 [Dendroctonus ponderosae]ERL87218.1 hypothetical protein D910_04617 [Dendroctonus ponderosae]KAH1005127.1 hypothetical protein HUJ04_006169 [Dendroctonus ponderosae]KAH1012218.1 hypothetical protein HUJ05_011412 [Dendroctonus ponderosae]